MKKGIVIIGANFGDEGKGLMTNFCCSKAENPIVVRFNSGAQAGHTVYYNELRHVFGHFGAGTLQGIPTYLSRYFVVNPILFIKEYKELERKGIKPVVYVDTESYVTTPYDMLLNQIAESSRKENRHGSCGIGFNETIIRCADERYNLQVKDLYGKDAMKKVKRIKEEYLKKRLAELKVTKIDKKYRELIKSDSLLIKFSSDLQKFKKYVEVKKFSELNNKTLIFEGAQGLMLHEGYKYFPYVTHSKTGIENVAELLSENNISDIQLEAIYVTRCYLTRHGAGPLPGEIRKKIYSNIVDLTNRPNRFQGVLRFAPINLDLIKENIDEDLQKIDLEKYSVKKSIALTCLNQIGEEKVLYTVENELRKAELSKFINDFKVYLGDKYKYYLCYDKLGKKII